MACLQPKRPRKINHPSTIHPHTYIQESHTRGRRVRTTFPHPIPSGHRETSHRRSAAGAAVMSSSRYGHMFVREAPTAAIQAGRRRLLRFVQTILRGHTGETSIRASHPRLARRAWYMSSASWKSGGFVSPYGGPPRMYASAVCASCEWDSQRTNAIWPSHCCNAAWQLEWSGYDYLPAQVGRYSTGWSDREIGLGCVRSWNLEEGCMHSSART